MAHQPIVQKLIDMIAANGWQEKFETALKKALSYNIAAMADIKTLDDYFNWLDAQLTWVPVENNYGTLVLDHVCKFYFILDQEPVKSLQNPVTPSPEERKLTELSKWMKEYIIQFGAFMDTPASLTPESLATFYSAPAYHMDEYVKPRGGWKTFNQFFARRAKPGYRPVAAITDDCVITSPADATFDGQWEIRPDSGVTIKGIHWHIDELLEGSPYKDEFLGGNWMHSFLNTTDYHRQHAPVNGTVLEARNIQGTVYLQVTAEPVPGSTTGEHKLVSKRVFGAPDDPGYEFIQQRALFVIKSSIGLVAVLPMGMAQVSSVVLTAEEGRFLQKGDELSYFQFGGSDIVMVFQNESNVSFTAQPGVHYKYGTRLAQAYPVGGKRPY